MSCTDVQTIQAGNGTKTQFSFDFPYIFKSEIYVYFWNATTKEYDEVLTTDSTYPWQITDANPTIVEFTSTAPPAPATPVDPGETAVDNVKIRRVTNIDDIRALFNPGSAIRSDDLNNNFEQLKYAIQESNCPGISDDVDQYLKDYYWDRFDNTLYSADTWRSDDATIATTAALDQRFQDEVNDTLTKAEFAAGGNVMPNNDNAVPTTGAVNDYINEVITNDIGGSDGISITDDGDGTITVGISANSVDFDRIKNEDIITEAEQDAGLPVASDSNLFTSLAAARRFDTFVQTSTPSGSDWEVGKTWLQNDSEKTVRIWDGAAWVAVASGGAFTTLDKVVYVDAVNGDDSLNGHRISNPKRTIKAAVQQINAESDADGDGSVIIVAPGVYQEVAPIDIQKKDVSIIGQALRSCIVHPTPATETESLFRLNSGSYVAGLTLTGVKASGTRGGNPLDTDATYGLPTSQGWNFSFYPGATIVKSPYIANCTNFSDSEIDNSDLNAHTPAGGSGGDIDSSPTGGGILVDGSTVDSNSPLRSMVCDSYTHVGLDGPGIFITNNGYCQATSSYSFFTHYHIKCLNGGQANLAASTTDFGRYSLIADGRSSSAIFTATTTTTASDGATTFTIGAPTAGSSWHGTATRPQANQLVDIGGNTYSILSSTPNGSGWDVEISRPDPNNLSINLGLDGAVSSGASVSFYLRSMIASSGHTMEYVGSGTDYRALPENGGVPVEANQTVELNNGKIWAAITDHQGKFTVGPTFNVDQVTGYVNIANGAIGIPQLIEDLDLNGFTLSDSTGNVVIDDVLDVNTNKIINVVDPTSAQDAATKNYVDTSSSNPNYVAVTGDTMSGTLDMDGNKVTNLAAPTASNDAARKVDVDSKVNKTGDTMTGDLTMSSQSDIRFGDSDNSAYIALRAPGSVGSSYTLSLPTSVGNAGEALVTDASGNLGWSSSLGTVVDNIVEGNSKVEVIDTGSNGQIQFITEGVQRMHIDASGNVGVGDNAPLAQLSIKNASGTTGFYMTRATSTSFGDVVSARIILDSAGPRIYGYGDALKFWTAAVDGAASEKVRITSDGKLGVGTSSPSGPIHVLGSADTGTMHWFGTSSGAASADVAINFATSTNATRAQIYAARVGSSPDGRLQFSTQRSGSLQTRMTINEIGNVGIGTTGPQTELHVENSSTTAAIRIKGSSTGEAQLQFVSGGQSTPWYISEDRFRNLVFKDNTTERARIDSSGRLLVGTSTARSLGGAARLFQVEGTSATSTGITTVRNSPGTGGPTIILGKTRGNSNGSNTIVLQDDQFGSIQFAGADGNDLDQTGASITAFVDGTPGANDMPGRLVFSTAANGASSPTERMRIKSDGKVGIGTNSPTRLLTIQSGSNANLCIKSANTGVSQCMFGDTDSDVAGNIAYRHSSNSMDFEVNGSTRATIDSSGRLGLGTSSPFADATATISDSSSPIIALERSGSGRFDAAIGMDDNADITFWGGANPGSRLVSDLNKLMVITSGGNVGVGSTSPARQLTVYNSSTPIIQLVNSTTGQTANDGVMLYESGSDFVIENQEAGEIKIYNNGSQRATIDSSGRLGLGTSIPQAKMEIVENAGGLDLVTPLRLSGTAVNNDDGWKLQFYNNTAAQEQGSLLVQYKTVGFWKTSLTSTDNVTFDTAGNERVRIDSSGRVGIGTTSPSSPINTGRLMVQGGDIVVRDDQAGNSWRRGALVFDIRNSNGHSKAAYIQGGRGSDISSNIQFYTTVSHALSERMRIDDSGRLLVGTSTSGDVGSALQVASTAFGVAEIFRTGSFGASLFIGSAGPGTLASPSALTNGEAAGYLTFRGYDSAAWRTGANISAHADGQTWASGDCPGRLVFSTTESGDSSPTERMRISSTGALGLSGANYGASGQVLTSNGSGSAPTWQNSATAQAWVHFDGTAATVTPADSYNVSSITDNGTGNYTVNLTNTLGSSSPACFASGTATSSRIGNASPNATDPDDKIDVGFKGTNDQLYNDANVSVVVFA